MENRKPEILPETYSGPRLEIEYSVPKSLIRIFIPLDTVVRFRFNRASRKVGDVVLATLIRIWITPNGVEIGQFDFPKSKVWIPGKSRLFLLYYAGCTLP